MKEKVITISLYILFALMVCIAGVYYMFAFALNDILNYYYNAILKYVFLLTMSSGVVLPIIKYRKKSPKWILPMVLSIMLLIIPVFNNGILKIVEDDLRIYTKEKWDRHKDLRSYMIDNLEADYLYNGRTEEEVKALLGEPDYISGENSECYEYFVNPGYIDPIMYYVRFEDGFVAETGKRYT